MIVRLCDHLRQYDHVTNQITNVSQLLRQKKCSHESEYKSDKNLNL